eukprot:108958_1
MQNATNVTTNVTINSNANAIYNITNANAKQSVPIQSVPLLVNNSSIGSVTSIPSLCSMPMQSIPSIPAFKYQSVHVQNTIQNSLPNINILNIQQYTNTKNI